MKPLYIFDLDGTLALIQHRRHFVERERGKQDWKGFYADPDVKYGGVKVGGIRISHLSHIDSVIIINLTAARGKRAPYRVDPINSQKEKVTLESVLKLIESAHDDPGFAKAAEMAGRLESNDDKTKARSAYAKKLAEIKRRTEAASHDHIVDPETGEIQTADGQPWEPSAEELEAIKARELVEAGEQQKPETQGWAPA